MEKQFRVRRSFRAPGLQTCFAACACLMVLGFLTDGARAGMLTIDDFTKPNPSLTFWVAAGMNPSKQITQSSTGAIGGQRDMLFHEMGQANPYSAVGFIGYYNTSFPNELHVGTNGPAPTVATLQYSGTNALNTPTNLFNAHALGGGLGVDLTNGGTNDRFLIQFMSSDAQPTVGLDVTVTITSPGGTSSKQVTVQNSLSAFNVYVPFNQLQGTASTSHADSITFVFNGANHAPNIDYEVSMLGTVGVPEPASGTLLMTACGILGLAAYAARRRRRRPLPAETG
jgi:hypothetical protein